MVNVNGKMQKTLPAQAKLKAQDTALATLNEAKAAQ